MDTLIGRQTEIVGDVRFSGGLHVDGRIKGNVQSSGDKSTTLSLSETGAIEGDVRVANVVVNGRIAGEVRASERLTLGAKARIVGDVRYRVLQMEAGALVNGQLIYEGNEVMSAITHVKGEGGREDGKSSAGHGSLSKAA
ncbi:MAG: polymer-forming cytoskeletal protein [Stagnimonas sp.]|nr:polymer-forming cytoskeletal protein [Stagnimonas sp.]